MTINRIPMPGIAARVAQSPLCVVDVGARGGVQREWDGIQQLTCFVGFEPDASEAERLQRVARPNERYLARGLHSQPGEVVLHHCVVPSRSSLYEPNWDVVRDLYGSTESFLVERTVPIEVTTLDLAFQHELAPMRPNFIKLDTQGSELDILKGGTRVLQGPLVGIEAEVEFMRVYRDQPLFADLDSFLRNSGYELAGFKNLYTRFDIRFGNRKNIATETFGQFVAAWASRLLPPDGDLGTYSRLVYGDALYLRNRDQYLEYAQQSSERSDELIAKAVFLATQLRYYEYGLSLLAHAGARGLVSRQDQIEIERYVRAHARDWSPLLRRASSLVGRVLGHMRLS